MGAPDHRRVHHLAVERHGAPALPGIENPARPGDRLGARCEPARGRRNLGGMDQELGGESEFGGIGRVGLDQEAPRAEFDGDASARRP